ncbi:MAG: RsbRD N-terminal domain-containing protein [Desulfovibrionales bacterium]
MQLFEYLQTNKKAVLKKWFQAISQGYPSDTCSFLLQQKDPFANPVGHTLRVETERIYDELLKEKCSDEIARYLDGIIRIFAVQDFTPSGALSFMFLLKNVVREEIHKAKEKPEAAHLYEFENRVDQTALLGFEIYVKCREQVWELKANAIRDRTHNILERAKLWKSTESEGDSAEDIQKSEQKKRGDQ